MHASLEIDCGDAEKILRSIEADAEPTEKFSAKMAAEKNKIFLEIEAKDISGLMAGVNSNLKLIKLAAEIDKIQ
ncbi:MAG TPA: KEOPS complex subunit Pcc1 [archaeon]|nr:KEOPS complex subunit Pcc1 [archaeon]